MKKLLILSIALSTLLLTGCQEAKNLLSAVQKPTIKMTGLNIDEVATESATVIFDVEVENPYSVSLPLTNLDYTVSTNGTKFMSGNSAAQQLIPANSTKAVSLPVTVNYTDIIKAAKSIKTGSSTIPYKADVDLSVTTPVLGDISIPVSKEGELKLPELDKSTVKSILNNLLSK